MELSGMRTKIQTWLVLASIQTGERLWYDTDHF